MKSVLKPLEPSLWLFTGVSGEAQRDIAGMSNVCYRIPSALAAAAAADDRHHNQTYNLDASLVVR